MTAEMLTLERRPAAEGKGALFVVTMHSPPDNRFTYEFIRAWNRVLDEIEDWVLQPAFQGQPAALVTTHGSAPGSTAQKTHVFSNGLVLDELKRDGVVYVEAYQRLLERMLTFRLPTVAAVNGHAFAGGCMFALAHDARVMNQDRGFLCMNEVELPGGLTPGMLSIIACKMPTPLVLRQCVLEARRFSATDAQALGLADGAAHAEEVLPKAIELATALSARISRAGPVFHYLKKELYRSTGTTLRAAELGHVWCNLQDLERFVKGARVGALRQTHGQEIPIVRTIGSTSSRRAKL